MDMRETIHFFKKLTGIFGYKKLQNKPPHCIRSLKLSHSCFRNRINRIHENIDRNVGWFLLIVRSNFVIVIFQNSIDQYCRIFRRRNIFTTKSISRKSIIRWSVVICFVFIVILFISIIICRQPLSLARFSLVWTKVLVLLIILWLFSNFVIFL